MARGQHLGRVMPVSPQGPWPSLLTGRGGRRPWLCLGGSSRGWRRLWGLERQGDGTLISAHVGRLSSRLYSPREAECCCFKPPQLWDLLQQPWEGDGQGRSLVGPGSRRLTPTGPSCGHTPSPGAGRAACRGSRAQGGSRGGREARGPRGCCGVCFSGAGRAPAPQSPTCPWHRAQTRGCGMCCVWCGCLALPSKPSVTSPHWHGPSHISTGPGHRHSVPRSLPRPLPACSLPTVLSQRFSLNLITGITKSRPQRPYNRCDAPVPVFGPR